jgi:hypothetical protein
MGGSIGGDDKYIWIFSHLVGGISGFEDSKGSRNFSFTRILGP